MIVWLRDFWSFWSAIFDRMDKTHMGLIAAGVAFYAMFAVFPGLAAIIALWSLWFDPEAIMAYVEVANEFLPEGSAKIIDGQIRSLTAACWHLDRVGVLRVLLYCNNIGAGRCRRADPWP